MINRINIICLGVKNIIISRTFYRELGFSTPNNEDNPGVVFFSNGGTRLELFNISRLAEDINAKNPPAITNGFNGITLAYDAKSKQEVDDIFNKIEIIGGKIAKKPEMVFWGGYSGYFQDPDGYYWEVAYADSWKFDENDMIIIE